jgi:hypothetical protein
MAGKKRKVYTVVYKPTMKEREFIEHGNVFEEKGKVTKKVPKIGEIRMKAGETRDLTQEEFNYLSSKGLILDENKLAKRNQLRGDLLKVKSGRAEPKKEMQIVADEDKRLMYIDIPELIEVKEVEE